MATLKRTAWSCVVDDHPAILAGIMPWLLTAIRIAGLRPDSIFVHHVCRLPTHVDNFCREQGIRTLPVKPLIAQFPHTNKIMQCATPYRGFDHVALMDVDMVFAGKPPMELITQPVCGKPVDLPNPMLPVLNGIFDAAGLPKPDLTAGSFIVAAGHSQPFSTFAGNFNGGLYILDRRYVRKIGRCWARRARWLAKRISLAGEWSYNLDQIAFCLAVNELGLKAQTLSDAWNLPMHLPHDVSGEEVCIIHHHASADVAKTLRERATKRTAEAVAKICRLLEADDGAV